MHVSWRPLAQNETDREMLWLSVSLGTAALGAGWLALHLPWPQCAFHALTGYPCLTCGATRSAIQFLRGHFVESWNFNPLAFVAYCLIACFDLYAAVVLLMRAPRLRLNPMTRGEKYFVRTLFLLLLAANWFHQVHAGI